MRRAPVVLAFWGFWLACAALVAGQRGTAPPPPRPAIEDVLRAQMEPTGAIGWSSRQPLSWRDFQGSPILTGDEAAHTAYSLFSAARCARDKFEFLVIAAILPGQSWVRPTVVADAMQNPAALRHEQTHFDLTETYARRMRKYFGELYDPCSRTEADLDGQAQRYITAESVMQGKYDDETRNGRLPAKQVEWDAEVARQLVSLGRYARDRSPD